MAELEIDDEFYSAFKQLLEALKGINDEIVIIGGMANALYQHHENAKPSPLGNIATKDLDILISDKLTNIDIDITEKLIEKGFEIDPKPIGNKIITKFVLADTNFEIEFLCPMYGGDPDRHEKRQLVKEVQKGLTVQPLRYLDLALYNTWKIDTENIDQLRGLNLSIQIPSPGAYLIQKFIIRNKKAMNSPAFLQKDCFYIYELLLKFSDNFESLVETINEVLDYNLVKKKNYKKVKSFIADFNEYFSGIDSIGIGYVKEELDSRGFFEIGKSDIDTLFTDFLAYLR